MREQRCNPVNWILEPSGVDSSVHWRATCRLFRKTPAIALPAQDLGRPVAFASFHFRR